MDGEPELRICSCGAEFMARDFMMDGRVVFAAKWCAACLAKAEMEAAAREAEDRKKERLFWWKEKCPPLYQNTNLADPRLPREAIAQIEAWQDMGDGAGLSLRGASGRGKTRLAFVLGQRLFMAGSSVECVSATRLAHLCVESYDDDNRIKNSAREKLRSIRSTRYLILDDLGKQKFTERAETELYDLIEHRTSHLLPTIWTANVSSDDFSEMMSADRGVPIIRRLAEFSKVINL